jgi:hypothetical protein
MNDIEKTLQAMQPREPSSSYLARGLERIAASAAPMTLVSPAWRYATLGLALFFSASLALNVVNWLEQRREALPEATLVFSVLRQEGDLWVQETRYDLRLPVQPGDDP